MRLDTKGKPIYEVGDRVTVGGCDIRGTVTNSTDWGIVVEMDYMRDRGYGRWVSSEITWHKNAHLIKEDNLTYGLAPKSKHWKRNPNNRAPYEIPEARDETQWRTSFLKSSALDSEVE